VRSDLRRSPPHPGWSPVQDYARRYERAGDRIRRIKPPVRLFADEGRDLEALRGDVPVSAVDTPTFAAELTVWLDELDTTPVYLSGLPGVREPDAVPSV